MKKFNLFSVRSGQSGGVEKSADRLIALLFVLCISLACIFSFFQLAGSIFYPHPADINRTTKINPADPNNGLPAARKLAQWDNLMKIRVLHVTQINNVVIGKDGWLYIDDSNSMNDYRGVDPYSESELAALAQVIDDRREWLSTKGIRLLLVFAPNKESIYPEYLPDDIYKVSNTTRLDQLIQYLKQHSDVDILDLRPALLQAKNVMPLYYSTDSHWNNYGAFVAYTEVMKKLSQYFPYLKPYGLDDYTISISEGHIGDLQHLLFMDGLFKDQSVRMTLKDGPVKLENWYKIPSAVIYHDSFGVALVPFLSQHVENLTDLRFGQVPMFDEQQITQANPDIVIYVMAERLVDQYFQNP